jgi:germination protein YpeB
MLKITSVSRRAFVRLMSFAAAVVLILSGFCYMGWRQAAIYRRGIEHEYQKAFNGLVDSVVAIDTALQKSSYAGSPPLIASLASEISRRAYGAQSSIGALPYAFAELENTSKFLSQVGEYADYLNRQAAFGIPLTEEQVLEVRRLSGVSSQLSINLSRLMTVAREENLNIGRLLANGKDVGQSGDPGGFRQTVEEIEDGFERLPMMVYDGHFSDHIGGRESVFLKDKPNIDRKEATARAAEYLDIQPALMQPLGETAGAIPAYLFRAIVDGGEIAIAVTRQGGYCLSLTDSRVIGDPRLTFEEAVDRAREYLVSQGYDGMKDLYYTRSGNMLLISFVYRFNDIIYYPDMIRVGVALDNGKICVIETSGYLMNHTYRDLAPPTLMVNQAMSVISDGLLVSSAEMRVIQTDGLNEILCYAFICIDNESRAFMVYVNAHTGVEEKILIIIENENGKMFV